MIINRSLYVMLTGVVLLLFGCNSNNSSTSSTEEQNSSSAKKGIVIPPKPSVRNSDDVPFFECLLNGEVFESASARGSHIEDLTTGKVLIDMSGVSGQIPGKDYITMVGLVIEEFKGPGKYDGYRSFYVKKIVQGSQDMLEWESSKGTINITEWDKETSSISGTFSTVVKNKEGNKIEIEGGIFKHVPLEILKVQ